MFVRKEQVKEISFQSNFFWKKQLTPSQVIFSNYSHQGNVTGPLLKLSLLIDLYQYPISSDNSGHDLTFPNQILFSIFSVRKSFACWWYPASLLYRKYLEHLDLLEHFRRRKGKIKQKNHSGSVESLWHSCKVIVMCCAESRA